MKALPRSHVFDLGSFSSSDTQSRGLPRLRNLATSPGLTPRPLRPRELRSQGPKARAKLAQGLGSGQVTPWEKEAAGRQKSPSRPQHSALGDTSPKVEKLDRSLICQAWRGCLREPCRDSFAEEFSAKGIAARCRSQGKRAKEQARASLLNPRAKVAFG
jgi:hypothetical protein